MLHAAKPASESREQVEVRGLTPKEAAQRHYMLQYDSRVNEINAQLKSVLPHQASFLDREVGHLLFSVTWQGQMLTLLQDQINPN